MHAHKHNPTPPTLTQINTSQLTWTCPQHVWGPHNSAVFTGTAWPLRQAGRRADCVSAHTPVPSARRNDPHSPPGGTQCGAPAWPRTRCEYHLVWPDCQQRAANRQCGGGQWFKLCSEITGTAWHVPHCELCIQFSGLLTQGVVASFVFLHFIKGQVTISQKKDKHLYEMLFNHTVVQFMCAQLLTTWTFFLCKRSSELNSKKNSF